MTEANGKKVAQLNEVIDSEKAKQHGVPDELIAEVEKDFDKLNKEMDSEVQFNPNIKNHSKPNYAF